MRRVAALSIAVAWACACAAAAHAGPPLEATPADLAASLECTADVDDATRDPVLLVPGTTVTPEEFRWNYMPALTAAGIPWCAVEPPGNMMADIQSSAEYVVHAIRTEHKRSGRKVDVIGHSQGGMIGRWVLRFWPDTRRKVDDLIGLAPSNHGTIIAAGICAPKCAAAIHQQRDDSAFMTALNTGGETYEGISYTSVYSQLDEVVVPNFGPEPSSTLRSGAGDVTNVATQAICPANIAEHLATGTYDAVGWAVAYDALERPGPADPNLIDRAVCLQPFMPGVDPLTFASDFGSSGLELVQGLSGGTQIPEEPPLRCYVTGSCPRAARCVVPSVTGKRIGRARQVLKRSGCRLGTVRGKRGRIVKQTPKAGAVRKPGKRVKIRVR